MLRVPRKELNAAIESVMVLMTKAVQVDGLKIIWNCEPDIVEKHLLGMLTSLTPSGPGDFILPEDVFHLKMSGIVPKELGGSGV